jgi:hypothetical protein
MLKEFIETIDNFDRLSKLLSITNDITPAFEIRYKTVFKEDNHFYRVDKKSETLIRKLISILCKEETDTNFFFDEKIIYYNDYLFITEQDKISPLPTIEEIEGIEIADFKDKKGFSENGQFNGSNLGYDFDQGIPKLILKHYKKKYNSIMDFISKYKIFGFHKNNFGITKDGKIVCFDYVINGALFNGALFEKDMISLNGKKYPISMEDALNK